MKKEILAFLLAKFKARLVTEPQKNDIVLGINPIYRFPDDRPYYIGKICATKFKPAHFLAANEVAVLYRTDNIAGSGLDYGYRDGWIIFRIGEKWCSGFNYEVNNLYKLTRMPSKEEFEIFERIFK